MTDSAEAGHTGSKFTWRTSLGVSLRKRGLLIAVLLVCAAFQVDTGFAFLGIDNLLGIFRSTSTLAILGLGFLPVLILGEIDLSFGYLYGLSASLIAVAWIIWGWPVWLAVLFAFLMAAGWGALNAAFTTLAGLPSFITTLASGTLMFGFTLLITGSNSYSPSYPPLGHTVDLGQVAAFNAISNASLPFGIPMQGVWMVFAALIMWFLLSRTIFGFRLLAIGGNPEAARLARLPVRKYKFVAFIICSLGACLAALLDFSFIGSTQVSGGQSLLFPALSAVIIGGASLSGGRGTVSGTLTGAILLAVILNGMAVATAGPFAQEMVLGTVVIGSVLLDQYTRSRDLVRVT